MLWRTRPQDNRRRITICATELARALLAKICTKYSMSTWPAVAEGSSNSHVNRRSLRLLQVPSYDRTKPRARPTNRIGKSGWIQLGHFQIRLPSPDREGAALVQRGPYFAGRCPAPS